MKRYGRTTYSILITAGPTIEKLDPVRYISNFSTGTMGYALAAEAAARGHKVCLISGPVCLDAPGVRKIVRVLTAEEMKRAVMKHVKNAGCLIMAAAVCDFRPRKASKGKIKKQPKQTIELIKNPDILAAVKRNKELVKIGFALETGNVLTGARKKMKEKGLDMIVANRAGKESPFGAGKTTLHLVDAEGRIRTFKDKNKRVCAKAIIDHAENLINDKHCKQ